ncbi:unnamed protein product [Toxocara canis]|uniref:Arylacetamide deacetylase n=1 Tax=Toxocara canis TaxID=6265 RepID=A0A183UC35_TOXCA|nr:unnamed protein product [Toxocara canis]
MALAAFLLITALLIAFVSMLYIPLPDGIGDRLKLQFVEFLLRISNEYFGKLVGVIFGPVVWNRLTRLIVAIPFIFKSGPPKWVTVRNELIGTTAVRVYYPQERKSNALILFIHGGGWAIMRAGYYDNVIYMLIARLGTLVISIDYMLSPENPYPGPVNECEAVFHKIVNEEHERFGINPNRICIMGDSAGGNLSTVIAQRQLRNKLLLPKCQVLIYPVIHSFDLKSPSYQVYYNELYGTSILNPCLMSRWYLLYLGIPATTANVEKFRNNCHLRSDTEQSEWLREMISHDVLPSEFWVKDCSDKYANSDPDDELCELFEKHGFDVDFAPILGDNLNGLPPAMIITAGYDILRDEGILYAKRLQSFSVAVQWNHYPAAYHGVINMPASMQRNQIIDDIAQYLNSNL